MMKPLVRTHLYWQDIAQEIAKWHFFIGRGFAELQIPNTWKWPYLLNSEGYCDKILQWDYQMAFGIGRGFVAVQILKKWN